MSEVTLRRRELLGEEGYPEFAEPGEFEMCGTGHIVLACPGCGKVSAMRVGNPKPAESPSWLVTGEGEKLTLDPSVNCRGCCGWHGFIRDGVCKRC